MTTRVRGPRTPVRGRPDDQTDDKSDNAGLRKAHANPSAVQGFIRGYQAGLRWTLEPDNRDAASALLLEQMPAIKPAVVDKVMDSLLSPRTGLSPQGRIDPEGVETVLELRRRYTGASALLPASAYLLG